MSTLSVPEAVGEESYLVPHRSKIDNWLNTIDERKRSAVLQYLKGERSAVISYLYASLLGVPCSVDEWDDWSKNQRAGLDLRGILESEIVSLLADVSELREGCGVKAEDEARGRSKGKGVADVATRISYLSRELRGHIEQIQKESMIQDRRSLLLAGIEVAAKILRKVHGKDSSLWPSVEACLEAAYAEIEFKNG